VYANLTLAIMRVVNDALGALLLVEEFILFFFTGGQIILEI